MASPQFLFGGGFDQLASQQTAYDQLNRQMAEADRAVAIQAAQIGLQEAARQQAIDEQRAARAEQSRQFDAAQEEQRRSRAEQLFAQDQARRDANRRWSYEMAVNNARGQAELNDRANRAREAQAASLFDRQWDLAAKERLQSLADVERQKELLERAKERADERAFREREFTWRTSQPTPLELNTQQMWLKQADTDAGFGRFSTAEDVLRAYPKISNEIAETMASRSLDARRQIEPDYLTATAIADRLNALNDVRERYAAEMARAKLSDADMAAALNRGESHYFGLGSPTFETQRNVIGDYFKPLGITSGPGAWTQFLTLEKQLDPMKLLNYVVRDPLTGRYRPTVPRPAWVYSTPPTASVGSRPPVLPTPVAPAPPTTIPTGTTNNVIRMRRLGPPSDWQWGPPIQMPSEYSF